MSFRRDDDDLDREDDEILDDEDEENEDDEQLGSRLGRRPEVRPFSSMGSGAGGAAERDSTQLPGSRPSSYQSRYGSGSGSSGSSSANPFSNPASSSGSRFGPPANPASRPAPPGGVIGARRDDDDEDDPDEKKPERPAAAASAGSPLRSAPPPGGSSPASSGGVGSFRSPSPAGGSSPASSGGAGGLRSSPPSAGGSSPASSGGAGGLRSAPPPGGSSPASSGGVGSFRSSPQSGSSTPAFTSSAAGGSKPAEGKDAKPAESKSGIGGLLGGVRDKVPLGKGGGDKAPAKSGEKSGSGGGLFGSVRDKVPLGKGGGDKAPAKAPAAKSGGGGGPLGGITQKLGGVTDKLPFGKGGDKAPAKPSASASSASASTAAGGRPPLGSRAAPTAAASAPAAKTPKKETPAGGVLARLPFFGRKDEKARPATTREKLERASKAPKLDEHGLTLDNKLDILGVVLVLGALALLFSSMSATKGQLTEAINTFLSQLLGSGAIAVPIIMFAAGTWLIIRHFGDEAPVIDPVRLGGVGLLYIGVLLLFQFLESFNPSYAGINLRNPDELRLQLDISYLLGRGGGWLGAELYYWLVTSWSEAGMVVFMLGIFVIGLMLLLRITAAELAIFVISIWRSFMDAQRRRAQTREARARLRAAELAAAVEARVTVSKPPVAELPAAQSPALPAAAGEMPEEPRPIPITMGGKTVTAFFEGAESAAASQPASPQPAAGSGPRSVAARLLGAVPVPALGRSAEPREAQPAASAAAKDLARSGGLPHPAGLLGGLLKRGDKDTKPETKPAETPAAAPALAAGPAPTSPATPAATASTLPVTAAEAQTPVVPAAVEPAASPTTAAPRLGDLLRPSERSSPFARPGQPAGSVTPTSPVSAQPQPLVDADDEADEDDEELTRLPASPAASSAPARPQGQSIWARPAAHPAAAPSGGTLEERRERLNALRSGQTAPVPSANPTATSGTPVTPEPKPAAPAAAPPQPHRPAASAVPVTPAPAPAATPRTPAVLSGESANGQHGASSAAPSASPSPAFARPAGPPSAPPARKRRDWKLPDYRSLLNTGSESDFDREHLLRQARMIEETLQSFGAPGRVVEVNTGPVITQFGVEPDYLVSRSGKKSRVKVGAIAQLDKDLQLALGAKSIRIEAPVPGKGYVGIEVPNEEASLVSLRDVMESEQFQKIKAKSPLAIALGQSVDGTPVSADLAGMPHLLVAGTTGSGKSVLVNAIIASLLLNNPPDRVKFIMVDPKRVELTGYNGIPHLVAPVVVDLERTVGVLKWVTREMDERYKQFSTAGARNIEDFNKHLPADREPMPYIVVIIDELADLMMLAPDETERVITRIAALARATGIHLVIATQRPSVDVVTGLIKANFPARIAFAVAGGVDSRVILDQPGAERLLGRGDMLYLSGTSPAPLRLQGVFVSDPEINNITRYWKRQNAEQPEPHIIRSLVVDDEAEDEDRRPQPVINTSYSQQAAFWDEGEDDEDDDMELSDRVKDERDELYDQAVEMVRRLNKASVSLLQRRLRIGYTRAARLIDMMEAEGIVGPAQEGSKPRDVLQSPPG
jgi:S-DNA-T family DNA segregation ATPase FtsK/SpoIIIE